MASQEFLTSNPTVTLDSRVPLAKRMAPQSLDELVGQEDLLSEGSLLRRMIEADRLSSIILYGPPGTGKTSIATVIAKQAKLKFVPINAVQSGVAELKQIIEESQNPILTPEGRRLLFIDEIHRFNKAQQDLLLPHVENGTLILIGATTENPFFEVNKALISRSTVFQLKPLSSAKILDLLKRALKEPERGLGQYAVELSPGSLELLAEASDGDARQALNALELAVVTAKIREDGRLHLSSADFAESLQKRSLLYDKDGESHYDCISALIKSIRGSDPDASLYYLARLIESGETIEFISRRLVISAAEDIGLANPNALMVAMSAAQAASFVGLPEARIPLAEAVIFLACSPKSNSAYLGINQALALLEKTGPKPIPMHLKNPVTKGMSELGYGKGYLYPHDYPHHLVEQTYLPDELEGAVFYQAQTEGYESKLAKFLNEKNAFLKAKSE